MDTHIKMSIIIPVYNVEKYVRQCIDSVLNQTYPNFELIIIDDGSTDNSPSICDAYATGDERISVIHQVNQGLSAARNTGIAAAQGEYIFFLDSDDFIVHDTDMEHLTVSLNTTNPDLAFILPREYNGSCTSIVKVHPKWPYDENVLYRTKNIFSEIYSSGLSLLVSFAQCKIIKVDFCKKNQLFFTKGIFHEDDEWIPRVLKCNPGVIFLNQVIYGYRRRDDSIIRTSEETKMSKKAMDKMSIAMSTLQIYDPEYTSEMILYYIQYYLSACLVYKILHSKELKQDLLRHYRETAPILNHLNRCNHGKFKAIYYFYQLFGKSFTFKLFMVLLRRNAGPNSRP